MLSKDWQVSCVIDKSWYIHESPCLKSDWLNDIRLFLKKNLNKLLYSKRSNISPHIGSNETLAYHLTLAYHHFYGLYELKP